MVRRLEAILSLLAVALLSASVEASVWAQLSAKKQAAGGTTRAKAAPTNLLDKPRRYTNAKFGFTMALPPGAKAVERDGTNQISVRSRKGYVINVQVGPKRSDIPLTHMSMLLSLSIWERASLGLRALRLAYGGRWFKRS